MRLKDRWRCPPPAGCAVGPSSHRTPRWSKPDSWSRQTPALTRGAFAGASWPRIRWILCRRGGPTIAHAMLSQRRDSSKRDGAFRLQRFQRGVRKWWHLRIECSDLIVLFGGPGGMCGNAPRLLWGKWSAADGIRPGPGHRGAGRLCSPETLKPVHHFPAPGPLATEGGGVDGR
jgi:hypothetical protein